MLTLVKILAGVISVCIAFLTITALYVIWSPAPPNSPTLWRCAATAGLFAFISAILLSLLDTLRRHSIAAEPESNQEASHQKPG